MPAGAGWADTAGVGAAVPAAGVGWADTAGVGTAVLPAGVGWADTAGVGTAVLPAGVGVACACTSGAAAAVPPGRSETAVIAEAAPPSMMTPVTASMSYTYIY